MTIGPVPPFISTREQTQDRASNAVGYFDPATLSGPINTIPGQGTPAPVGGALLNQHDATLKALYALVQSMQTALNALTGTPVVMSSFPGADPSGKSGNIVAVRQALAKSVQLGTELLIDCPTFYPIGSDYTQVLNIPANAKIRCQGAGQIILDNIGPSALNLMGNNITFTNLNVLYNAPFWTVAISYFGGSILTGSLTTAGTLYVNGIYNSVPLTGGNGSTAFANITVAGGLVTNVVIASPGAAYAAGNTLSCSNAFLGGAGSGFVWTVSTVNSEPAWAIALDNSIAVGKTNYLQGLYNATGGGVNFINGAHANGNSPTNECALIDVHGGFTGHRFRGETTLAVPAGAPACNFIPTAIEFGVQYNLGSTVTGTGAINQGAGAGVTLSNGGTGYVNGIYNNVLLTGGAGNSATAIIVVGGVTSGVVSSVTIQQPGFAYVATNTLSASNASLGGSGSGLVITINTVGATPISAYTGTPPSDIVFDSLTLDGFCMGATGALIGVHVKKYRTRRYSDAQNSIANDPLGLQVGSLSYWFAPPHALYCTQPAYSCYHWFDDWVDDGPYVGLATRRSTASGTLQACKMTLSNNTYVNIVSSRPDGAVQVSSDLQSNGKLRVKSTYVSTASWAVNAGGQPGHAAAIAFPGGNPINEAFIDFNLIDTAPVPIGFPLGSDGNVNHVGVVGKGSIVVQDWPATAYTVANSAGYTGAAATYNVSNPSFGFAGNNNNFDVDIAFAACTSTQIIKGCFVNSGSAVSQGGIYKLKISGWRSLAGNAENLKQRIVPGGNFTGNTIDILDTTNNMRLLFEDGMVDEIYKQGLIVVPSAGATSAVTLMPVPTTAGVESYSWAVWQTALNGATSVNLGWVSGSATAIASALPVAALSTPISPMGSPLAVGGTGVPLLTAVGSNFTVNVSSTATGGTVSALVDSTQTWTVNQFKNYGIYNITKGWAVVIPDNAAGFDAHTLPFSYPQATAAAAGDTYIVAPCALLTISARRQYGVF